MDHVQDDGADLARVLAEFGFAVNGGKLPDHDGGHSGLASIAYGLSYAIGAVGRYTRQIGQRRIYTLIARRVMSDANEVNEVTSRLAERVVAYNNEAADVAPRVIALREAANAGGAVDPEQASQLQAVMQILSSVPSLAAQRTEIAVIGEELRTSGERLLARLEKVDAAAPGFMKPLVSQMIQHVHARLLAMQDLVIEPLLVSAPTSLQPARDFVAALRDRIGHIGAPERTEYPATPQLSPVP